MKPRSYRRFLVLVLALAAAGCGGKPAMKTVNVSGTVYLDGKPAEGVEVHFLAEHHSGYAVTAADGTYQLVQGAEPGENKLFFRKIVSDKFNNDPESGMDFGQLEAEALSAGGSGFVRIPGQVIPPEYSDPTKSNITFPVPEGGTESADFRLTSK